MREESYPRSIGRYLLFGEIAAGGMATVHWGRLSGAAGFTRTVAIKRLHPGLALDAEFVAMFLDEARLAARVHHPNVVPTLDVVSLDGEIFVVMEYVHGESLSKLFRAALRKRKPVDPRIITSVMSGVLHGLHAAHEARDERGQLLRLVHRDVSPQNIMVGTDGLARVLDFGVAQAIGRIQSTSTGRIKGKLAYMAPEYLSGGTVTRQADVYAAGVVIWEALTGFRLFRGEHHAAIISAVLHQPVSPPSMLAPGIPPTFDQIVMRALARDPARRYATARDMALDLERYTASASTTEVSEWVESLVSEELARRSLLMAELERVSLTDIGERGTLALPTQRLTPPEPHGSSASLSLPSQSEVHPVTLPQDLARARPRRRLVLAGLAGAAVAAGVIGLLLAATTGSSPAPALLQNAFSLPGIAMAPQPAPPVSAASTQAEAPAAEPVQPASGENATGAAEPPATPSAPSPVRQRAAPVRSVPSPKRVDCRVPYTIDERGHKRYKAACL